MASMSKSIFIIDTPVCCGECPMSGTDVCREWNMKEAQAFPKDCPLKPAYDVDKVVEQLEAESERWKESGEAYEDQKELGVSEGFKKAIEIAKSGGIR